MTHVWGFSSDKGVRRRDSRDSSKNTWGIELLLLLLQVVHCYAYKGKDCLTATKDRGTLFILATKYDQGEEGAGAEHIGTSG